MAGEHDAISGEWDRLGNWHIRCRCGLDIRRVNKKQAIEAHKLHFDAETVGKPGVQAAREALERGKEHGGS
jgi:hypothetical protein